MDGWIDGWMDGRMDAEICVLCLNVSIEQFFVNLDVRHFLFREMLVEYVACLCGKVFYVTADDVIGKSRSGKDNT